MGWSDLASRAIVESPPTTDALIAPDADALKADELLETSTAVSKALAELDEHLASIGAGITPAPVMRGAPTGAGKTGAEKKFELAIDADALLIDDPTRPSSEPDTSTSARRPRPSALSTEISGRYARLSIPGTSESGRYKRPSTPGTSEPGRHARASAPGASDSGRFDLLSEPGTSNTDRGLRARATLTGEPTSTHAPVEKAQEPLAPIEPEDIPLAPLPLEVDELPVATSVLLGTNARDESLPASTAQRAGGTAPSSGSSAGTRSASSNEVAGAASRIPSAKPGTASARTKAPSDPVTARTNTATRPAPAAQAAASNTARAASSPRSASTQAGTNAQASAPMPSVYPAAPSQVPQAANVNAPPPAMDRDFIARNQIVERYLSGKLPIKGATDFERFCHGNPELLDEIGLPQRVHAGLRLLESAGKPEPWHETTQKRFWEKPALVLGLAGVTVALATTAVFMSQQISDRNSQIAKLQKAVIEQPLEAAGTTRTIRVLPNRTGSSNTPAVTIGGASTQLADLRLDMSRSPFRAFRITIDRIDQGRVAVLHNIYKDSNGHVRIALNSSALGPGSYSFSIEGLTWRGETAPDAWVTIGIQR